MIDRRAFLRAAGLAGAGTVLAGCSSADTTAPGAPGTTTSPVPTATTTVTVPPAPPNWESLRARISGTLFLPGDKDFDTVRQVYNPLVDGRKPAAVARCQTIEDVQACVSLAAESKVPIAARGGGHSYAGYSVPESGLQVDLSELKKVAVRPDGTVRIGAGAKLVDVYTELAKAGKCLPAGSCPTVGIAGLTLGGGIGVLSRKFGLTCDRLDAATVITADSRVVEASSARDTDLFWALRGGGGGNFGIVTEFVFAPLPAPALAVFTMRFPAGSATDVLGAWQQWIAAAPPELWSNIIVTGAAQAPACEVSGCHVGSLGELNGLLAGLKVRPSSRVVQAKEYLDGMRFFAGSSRRQSFVASSRMLPGPADPAKITRMMTGRPGLDLLIDSLGGAIADLGPSDTAFPHRKAFASAQIYMKADAADAARATTQVSEVRDALTEVAGTTGYVNYIDPTMPDWADAYYGANLPRLRKIAETVDPHRVFAFPQAIPRA
ncbi:FAD-binding oxidoreductase [Kibdelosporangium persicum]|uniref:Berberine and berberine like n=1 Tax=Kibdelosporangium persicum TaxID=2698649 RepID=A0ABX2F046_9PSEU|nr:FAD-binding oxidoreductase [Kibdelosporangium persicum]NRN64582.1 Berberine and berberine like [Kibdelosporangium persicum]